MNGIASHDSYEHAPSIHLLNTLIQVAVAGRASDIHIEPHEHNGLVRMRFDGMLHEYQRFDSAFIQQLISRIKVMAHIDITQARIPQDGKFRINIAHRDIDFRVSTFPCVYGEKAVIRILDRNNQMIAIDALGFSVAMQAYIADVLQKEQGFVLISGPTGSGKTTTMYAFLAHLNHADRHIITLEDPVEYNLAGVTQAQINPDVGFTFAKGMRSLLRQDPDVVMVGEIRDSETAHIALEASLTGHMVMSSVHAHDAPSVVMRLIEMGIEPFLINASLSAVVAQRLVRKICEACITSYTPIDQERVWLDQHEINLDLLYKGRGCTACKGTGYKGRIGIFQLLRMTHELRALLVHSPRIDDIVLQAQRDGMQTLMIDGVEKIRRGITSVSELVRITL